MKYLKNYSDINRPAAEGGNVQEQKPEFTPAPKLHKDAKPLDRWKIFAIISTIALLTVLSVMNVIQVNDLLKHKNNLEKEHQKLKYRNDLLRAQINELESPERITNIAKEKMGMINQAQAPQFINK